MVSAARGGLMSCVEIVPLDRQETFSIVDRWKDLCAAAAMLPGFNIPERCMSAWRKESCVAACDDLENILIIFFVYCRIGAMDFLEHTPIVWGESLDDRRAIRIGVARLKMPLAKAIRKEAASWQLLVAADLIDKLCRDYRRLIASHGEKCSCLTGHDGRWRQGQHRYRH
jgi:hypothetical protein